MTSLGWFWMCIAIVLAALYASQKKGKDSQLNSRLPIEQNSMHRWNATDLREVESRLSKIIMNNHSPHMSVLVLTRKLDLVQLEIRRRRWQDKPAKHKST